MSDRYDPHEGGEADMNIVEETQKIEHAGYPSLADAVAGEPDEDTNSIPVIGVDDGERQRSFGLMLSVEVMNGGETTFGDLLNSVANSWRGREELPAKPGMNGAIRNEDGAPIGLWTVIYE